MSISKFVAKIRIIWELANFRSASRTGDCGSASRTGDYGTGGTGGTGGTSGTSGTGGTGEMSGTGGTGGTGETGETGRNEDIFSSFGRVNSYLYFGDCSFIVR